MFNLDPPEHTTVRRVVPPFFGPAAAKALEPAIALDDTELHGVRIRAGDAVVTPWVAATWDPEHYKQPERFRLDRSTREDPAITFGTGPHFCLGVNIARLYLQTALSTLFTQLPELALAAKHEDIAWEPDTYLFTRPTELPVTWS